MRFKKGSKVEVLNLREVPSGSWWPAEIISCNGHNYDVKYAAYPRTMGGAVERVPRRAVRPCPPPGSGNRNWVAGDIVEVLEKTSWKIAEVAGVVSESYFFVRLLGSSRQFRAHMSDIRLRQNWRDNKWIIVGQAFSKWQAGKEIRFSEDGKISQQIPQDCTVVEDHAGGHHLQHAHYSVYDERYRSVSRCMKKRSRACLPSTIEACDAAYRKMGAVERGAWFQFNSAEPPSHLLGKVVAVASPEKVMDDIYFHAHLNNRTTGFSQGHTARRKSTAGDKNHHVACLGPNDADTTSSSVGSCSPSHSQYMSLFPCPLTCPVKDISRVCGEADPCCGSAMENPLSKQELVEGEIHKLELRAYRSTLEALYASGPISWDQEILMTNLRLMLHISNDEHLSELRQLVSPE